MVFNAAFNNISVISWWSVLLAEELIETSKPITFLKFEYTYMYNTCQVLMNHCYWAR